MKAYKLLVSAVLPMLSLSAFAQEDNSPKAGDLTVAATLGYNSYTTVSALPGNNTDYELAAPSSLWSDKKLMVGFELGWFAGDVWKLNLGGGLNFTHNPGYSEMLGTATAGSDDTLGDIPNYRAIASQYSCTYNVYTGVDRYFPIKGVSNLQAYTGVRVGAAYAQNRQKYDEWTSMGTSVGEAWNLRANLVVGMDYFVTPVLWLGIAVDPFQYTYTMASYKPQPGLAPIQADSHSFSVFAAPTLKVGFKF